MSEKKKKDVRRGVQPFEEQLDHYDDVYEKRLKALEKARAKKQQMIANGELEPNGRKKKPAPKVRKRKNKKPLSLIATIKEVAGLAPTEKIEGTATAEDIKNVARYLIERPRQELDEMERNPKMPMYGIIFIRAIKKDGALGNMKNFQWLYENLIKAEETQNTGEIIFQSSFIQADDIEYVEEETDENE